MKSGRINLVVLLLLITAVAFCWSETCPRDLPDTTLMKRFRDYCYQFVSQEKYWYQARDFCLQHGGRLVKISDAETNDFIIQSLNELWWRNRGVWIGLHDTKREMQFQWTGYKSDENEAVTWTNWARGHPGAFLHRFRDCVRMVRGSGDWKWHETLCSTLDWHYRFICEFKVSENHEGEHLGLRMENPSLQRFQESLPIKKFSFPASASDSLTAKVAVLTTTQHLQTEVIHENSQENLVDVDPEMEDHTTWETEETEKHTVDYNVTYYDDEEPGLLKQVYLVEEKPLGNRGYLMTCILLVVPICFIVLAAYILYKRSRNKKMTDNGDPKVVSEHIKGEIKETIETEEERSKSSTPMAVSNIYIINEDLKAGYSELVSSSLPNEDDDKQVGYDALVVAGDLRLTTSENGNDPSDCGMMGYDMPKPSNLYAEIPEFDGCLSTEDHIYESLDDVIPKA